MSLDASPVTPPPTYMHTARTHARTHALPELHPPGSFFSPYYLQIISCPEENPSLAIGFRSRAWPNHRVG